MSKKREMQRLIRAYKDETGEREVDMHKVAKWAAGKGWPLPTPPDPLDMLARQFTDAAREETNYDKVTGKPYRVYHAIRTSHGGTQLHLFVDIDEATRAQMLVSLVNRREQMISDGVMLTYDQNHWNSIHPEKEPIQLTMDLALDVEWRINTPDDDEGSGGGGSSAS